MAIATLDGALLSRVLRGGAGNLREQRKVINDLNVFPIPDGDTGDNMYMTIHSGALNVGEEKELGAIAARAADGMLHGARGNSGVILSRYFKGIALGLEGLTTCDLVAFAAALERGVVEAYRAVPTPVEGTILTVSKEGVAYAAARMTEGQTFETYFENLIAGLKESLDRTPDLLPVLKEAGVVDSGGAGLLVITEGMRDGLLGKEFTEDTAAAEGHKLPDLNKFTENDEMVFGYCTEFLLRLQTSKVDIKTFDVPAFIAWLESHGNSVVCFLDGSIVKVHVHTMTPGDILNYAQKFGEFLTLKIENMTLQHEEVTIQNNFNGKVKKDKKKYGIVAVAAGAGLKETFSALGTDVVVDGGQSMNPSADDFLRAFEETQARTIFVFPNNGNVVMTAKQAASLYKDSDIRVIPTKTVGEGYAAISMIDLSEPNSAVIEKSCIEVIEGVVTGVVSRASRDTTVGEVAVHSGDYIGFVGDDVLTDNADRKTALLKLSEKINAGKYDVLLLLSGADAPAEEVRAAASELTARYKHTEVITVDGGQPIYDYIMILE